MSKKIVTVKLIKFPKCLMKIGFFVVLCWESKIINYSKKVLLNSKKKTLTAMDIAPDDS